MDVKDAIGLARDYLGMVFSDEDISEVRLEEVSFDREEKSWLITFGLLRPGSGTTESIFAAGMGPLTLKRDYKIVKIPADQNDQPSIRIREVAE